MSRAAELWIDGRDTPLVEPEWEVRLPFEGGPAIQFMGWLSVAVGIFPGRVERGGATIDGTGRFRRIVLPQTGQEDSWPSGSGS